MPMSLCRWSHQVPWPPTYTLPCRPWCIETKRWPKVCLGCWILLPFLPIVLGWAASLSQWAKLDVGLAFCALVSFCDLVWHFCFFIGTLMYSLFSGGLFCLFYALLFYLSVQSWAKVSGIIRYFRAASTWKGRLYRLTWPGWTYRSPFNREHEPPSMSNPCSWQWSFSSISIVHYVLAEFQWGKT